MNEIITEIYAIPTTNQSPNVFKTIEKIIHQLGAFNCDICDDAAAISYESIISAERKAMLQDIAKKDNYTLLFIEAEEETKWIDCETIHIPTTEEMKKHLAWE